ncbi:30S ribosomal protein S3 [Wolbachia endosymbiont of Litomosoides brasiliensis]|uniref:30S ribosomal protein S3 n=1 Tax=Wolbachia endosymbiont of Litomosoides brasiliensis TaxID=1812117 RepID=UPI00158BFF0D|nr:30S ribosomal protein S3 [Wolbachia endosymbiont of Litomosoides brasiliensis]NUY39603.1 30S ribosomal protein S3 [Wolbachia endosymbiont of Litomosoides brasiliensis]
MGQKVNPIGFRLKINANTWDSIWYASKDYREKLHQDLFIRSCINESFKYAGLSRIIIERKVDLVSVTIYSSRPGVVIGKKGLDIEKVKQKIAERVKNNVEVNVVGIKRPEVDAALISSSIAQQLEKRVSFRRAMKKAIQSCLRMGGGGIKVGCSGRLGGAEIARTEWYKEGRLPLHTLRANIDYAFCEAKTIYGIIGVKVWVYVVN